MEYLKGYRYFLLIVFMAVSLTVFSESDGKKAFKDIIDIECTSVKSQGRTGTCWSFATTSFLESELLRMGKGEFDLSEMFFVKHTYQNKAFRYLLFHGRTNFSPGGQAHDVLNVVKELGMVPNEVFPGKLENGKLFHTDMDIQLLEQLQSINKKRNKFDITKVDKLEGVYDKYLGKIPDEFSYKGKSYTPELFRDFLGINPEDYIEITSYSHHPFYGKIILEMPDNWSHDLYYNVPVDELMAIIKYSLKKGYSLCWDGDTSENTFRHKSGKADLPEKLIGKINQELRQEAFLKRETTDDHLMHITGMAENSKGRVFFKTKNSWGAESNSLGGFLYLSEEYARLKTLAILVHRNAVPTEILNKLGLK